MTEKQVKAYVTDTSAIIEKILSTRIKNKKITSGKIIIPHAVVAELENQANKRKEIGLIGLEEIQELRETTLKNKKFSIEFLGNRPTEHQIRLAKSGEIDAYIRSLAGEQKATLITADLVQATSARALGISVEYIEIKKFQEALSLQKYLDDKTMSLHIKEGTPIMAKKGSPGSWELVKVTKNKIKAEEIQNYAKEIIEKTRMDRKSYTEISRGCTTVVQYRNLRIVMVKPPVSDGWEITIVHPLTKLNLNEYKLPDTLAERIEYRARGIVICGETGSGKTTLAQAVAEWYVKDNRIVKTVESPRDLQLPDAVTQYSKNFTEKGEMHDILFLSRPDNVLFDEMRSTPDFELYTDLRLGGSNMIGVLHAAQAIDAIQRFLSRLDVGVLPNVVDTIIFVESGKINKVLTLKMLVKVPTGMTESDLARPVVEIRDQATDKLEYEVYSYGEQTVVIPVTEQATKAKGALRLAEREIENYFFDYTNNVKAEVISPTRAIVYVPESKIAKIIGNAGRNIAQCEEDLGISIEIRELKKEKRKLQFKVSQDNKSILIYAEPGKSVEVFVDGNFITSAITSKKGEIKIHKKSMQGRELLNGMSKKKKIEVKA
jgi:ATPase